MIDETQMTTKGSVINSIVFFFIPVGIMAVLEFWGVSTLNIQSPPLRFVVAASWLLGLCGLGLLIYQMVDVLAQPHHLDNSNAFERADKARYRRLGFMAFTTVAGAFLLL